MKGNVKVRLTFIFLVFSVLYGFKFQSRPIIQRKKSSSIDDLLLFPNSHPTNVPSIKLNQTTISFEETGGCVLDVFNAITSTNIPQVSSKSDGNLVRLPEFEHCEVSSGSDFILPDLGAWRSFVTPTDLSTTTTAATTTNTTESNLSSSYENRIQDDHSPPDSIIHFFQTQKLSTSHENKVLELWNMVKNRGSIKRFASTDIERIILAIRVAYVAFYGKTTLRSLEVLINRSRGTASVLGELRADPDVIIAGILHDIFSDFPSTDYYQEMKTNLVRLFGDKAIELIEKYQKLPNFLARKTSYTLAQSENQMQMLVAHAEEYRVLYIRLADRLHSMRVLRSLPIDVLEQEKIAQEALNVYAPLAHKMGVMKVKGELEDLAFRVLYPDSFQKSKYTQIAAHKAFHEASEAIQSIMLSDQYLLHQNVTYKLTSRIKGKLQLYLKMKRKGLQNMSQVEDALGLRVIIDVPRFYNETDEFFTNRSNTACYHIVERLSSLKGWIPGKFKDYIKLAKSNGYSSLHFFIRNMALGTNVEIQIRTRQMHINAELGEAAHWYYKDNIYRPEIANSKLYRVAWRSPEQMHATSSAEFCGLARRQLNAQRVFVFLEDESTVLNLRKGATALDAAFCLHTDIGLCTKSVSIHGRPTQFNQTLKSGDVISVDFKDTRIAAEPAWLSMVRLPHSQSVLRKHFRERQHALIAVLGCVQLMITLTANKDIIRKRFFGSFPTVGQLQRYCYARAGVRDLGELLVHLGTSSVADNRLIIGKLLDIPPQELVVFSTTGALLWTRGQNKIGWSDVNLRLEVLAPLLRDVMVHCGVHGIVTRWEEVIGSAPYSTKNSTSIFPSHLQLSSGIENVPERRNPRIYLKSDNQIAQKPFSLEAPSLSASLRQLARSQVRDRILDS